MNPILTVSARLRRCSLPVVLGLILVPTGHAQRAKARCEWQDREVVLEYGAARLGKHSLEELPVGQEWRLGMNEASVLTLETSMRHVLPLNMMAIALGLHVRCGIEDNIWNQRQTAKMGTVAQIEQLVRIAREMGRDVADGDEARQIYRIGTFYENADETLAKNGFAPNRRPRQAELARS